MPSGDSSGGFYVSRQYAEGWYAGMPPEKYDRAVVTDEMVYDAAQAIAMYCEGFKPTEDEMIQSQDGPARVAWDAIKGTPCI